MEAIETEVELFLNDSSMKVVDVEPALAVKHKIANTIIGFFSFKRVKPEFSVKIG